ncbi:MAG: patatin-like phospholipase family protein [Actinomycetota bacterium]
MVQPPNRLLNALTDPLLSLRRRVRGRRRRVAFVFSGGGNLGAVQVGMLRALAEAGVVPDLIIGCSVGSINGAAFAAEPNLAGVERLDRIWRRIADGDPDIMPSRFMPIAAQMARRGAAMHDADRLAELLDDELKTKTFDGLRIPFQCVTTDVESAAEYWIDSGRLVPALLASAALPAVYPAVEYRGRTLIDGGVLNEIHTARAVALGATELYVLHVGHLEDREHEIQRPFDAAVRAYWTARRFRLEDDLTNVPAHCVVHRLPAGSKPRLRFDDFSQAGELSDLAYQASTEYLRTGRSPSPVTGPISEPEPDGDDRDETADRATTDGSEETDDTAGPGWKETGSKETGSNTANGSGGGPDRVGQPDADQAPGPVR